MFDRDTILDYLTLSCTGCALPVFVLAAFVAFILAAVLLIPR